MVPWLNVAFNESPSFTRQSFTFRFQIGNKPQKIFIFGAEVSVREVWMSGKNSFLIIEIKLNRFYLIELILFT